MDLDKRLKDLTHKSAGFGQIDINYLNKINANMINKSKKRVDDIKIKIQKDISKNNFTKMYQIKSFIEYKQIRDYCKTFDLKDHTPAWCNDKNGLKMNKLEKIIVGNYFCCRECDTPMTFINKKIDIMYFYFSSDN